MEDGRVILRADQREWWCCPRQMVEDERAGAGVLVRSALETLTLRKGRYSQEVGSR